VIGASASLTRQIVGSGPADSFSLLQLQIHDDLRAQHPEWIGPNGESPMCDLYEARLARLLEMYSQTGSDESVAAVHRALQDEASADHLRAR
jgi:hypothetical protein